jgi:hypothetical protein
MTAAAALYSHASSPRLSRSDRKSTLQFLIGAYGFVRRLNGFGFFISAASLKISSVTTQTMNETTTRIDMVPAEGLTWHSRMRDRAEVPGSFESGDLVRTSELYRIGWLQERLDGRSYEKRNRNEIRTGSDVRPKERYREPIVSDVTSGPLRG